MPTSDYDFTHSASASDINNDGRQDMAVLFTPGYDIGWALQILIQQPDGSFADETQSRLGTSLYGTSTWMAFIEFQDFNQDGYLDIVPTDYQFDVNQPAVWLNDGTGNFNHLTVADIVQDDQESELFGSWNIVVRESGTTLERFYIDGSGLHHAVFSEVTTPTIQGDDNANTLTGTVVAEIINGIGVDDIINGSGGNDVIDGGAGSDIAVFSGARSDYIVFTNNGVTTVMDLAANRDGTNSLQNIESLTFGTETVTLASALIEPADSDSSPYQIYRFFNSLTGSHFFSTSIDERNSVITNIPTMTYEGDAFDSNATEAGGGAAVFRFYNSASGVHFYTASADEASNIRTNLPQFVDEGVVYYASLTADSGGTALCRFLNTQNGTHFYTTSETERDNTIATLGHYTYEGVAYYVDLA